MRDRKDSGGKSHIETLLFLFFFLTYLCYILLWHKDMQRT